MKLRFEINDMHAHAYTTTLPKRMRAVPASTADFTGVVDEERVVRRDMDLVCCERRSNRIYQRGKNCADDHLKKDPGRVWKVPARCDGA